MIFSERKINIGRQSELDYSRGFDALIIVMCHVGLYLGDSGNRALFTFSDIIGSEPGAPVFMALMGSGIAYSKHHNPKAMLLRGVTLFFGGFLLSAFRTLLPRLIFGNIDEWTSFDAFFVVDILQFAGLTFMFFALLKKMEIPSWGILALSLALVGIGQLFIASPPDIRNIYFVYLINLFIPITEWSCFPFLTWFFFPAFGLVFGEVLLRCADKKRLYGILLPVSLLAVLYVYGEFCRYYPAYAENYYFGGNFYYMGIKNVLLTSLFITFILSFWYFADRFLPKIVKQYLTFLSRNLTVFYIFTWIFISILIHIGAKFSITYPTVTTIALMVALTAACSISTRVYLFSRNKLRAYLSKNTNT